MKPSENLSEKLFKPSVSAKETSTIIGSLGQYSNDIHTALDGKSHNNWYRVLRRPQWSWQGFDPIKIEETLAKIAGSKNSRSHEDKLDTVIGYRAGNWVYEWSQNAIEAEKQAKLYYAAKQFNQASRQWLIASSLFSLAAYPYLKGDFLARQAELLASKNFHLATEHFAYKVTTVTTKVDGKALEGFLYLPHTDEPLPTVILSVGFDCLQTDLWPLFEKYFLPANIAMLTIDMPSIGLSNHWYLTEDTSRLHQAMLHELKNLPWVDHTKVGCLGIRFGANAAVRLAFLEPERLKSCVSLGGILHETLCDKAKLEQLPAMQLDILASRMGKKVSSALLTRLKALSLKQQGLLSGRSTPVPLLALGLSADPLGSKADNLLAARFSKEGKAKVIPSSPLHDAYHRAMLESIEWFKATL